MRIYVIDENDLRIITHPAVHCEKWSISVCKIKTVIILSLLVAINALILSYQSIYINSAYKQLRIRLLGSY